MDQDKSSSVAARFQASWGYDVHVELKLTHDDWAKVLAGESVSLRGDGYEYEGDFFWDYWDFSGGLTGELVVTYDSPEDDDYSGEGWSGKVDEALCQVNRP
jgi:hypothetical protein